MKKKCLLVFASLFIFYSVHAQNNNLKLWYNKPASIWEEALPLGNAKTGAMVFGGIVTERFQLNDNTLWSGYPDAGNNPNGPKILPHVRQQIFAGNWDSATTLWKKMQGPYSARYLPLADLWIKNYHDSITTSYYRALDLSNATSTVKYTVGGITYQRETFISHPDKIMVIRISADRRSSVNFKAAITSKLKYEVNSRITSAKEGAIILKGKAPKFVANRDYEPKQVEYDDWNGEGMNFEVDVKIVCRGGLIEKTGRHLTISKADAVTIYVSEATSFNGFDKSAGLN